MGIHPSVRISLSVLGFIFAFFLCLLLLPATQQASSQKQIPRQPNDPIPTSFNRQQTSGLKRRMIFAHNLPPEVKIEIQNLQNDSWPKDLEVVIKNVSDKPIYYVYILLVMDELKIDGVPAGFILEYGSEKFSNNQHLAEKDDVPIKPGESYTLKIPEDHIKNVEKKFADLGIEFKVTQIKFNLNKINFGNGTGYHGRTPYDIRKKANTVESSFLSVKPKRMGVAPFRASPGIKPISYVKPLFSTFALNTETDYRFVTNAFSKHAYNAYEECGYWIFYDTTCHGCQFNG